MILVDRTVALLTHVIMTQGSIGEWVRCNSNLNFTKTLDDVRAYHLNLSKKVYRSLIFSGDHDMVVPHRSTETWIKDLNFSFIDQWRSWKLHGQIAGVVGIQPLSPSLKNVLPCSKGGYLINHYKH
ncbi:putative serine carboxypeptidase-like 52 [Cynara cardunculus var. scolymus]|uniref:putative serine carboxypeptidase-like 52 n=1 Tax=Cynara cardunculus var. scolymus TaxID=59895 RepID=UPI000D6246EE|nr:putative serine carboxypeptidase-like 52 [Cynara cardunculus var. scolymus]